MNTGVMTTAKAEEILRDERRTMQAQVRHEYYDRQNPNDLINRELQNDSPEVSHVYGGAMSNQPQEGQIVQAWRPTPRGEWQLAKGIIHRVHSEDKTVTVQFVPDQHRVRVGFMNVQPLFDFTPEYPTIRMVPGERLPTRAEILAREQNANLLREEMGIAPDAPLPGAESDLRVGETRRADGSVIIQGDHWGIPGPTLDALRNRSVPPGHVTGEYGRHFYTNLYRNNFYLGKEQLISADGRVGVEQQHRREDGPHIISHTYIPLSGPELEQDLSSGKWYAVADDADAQRAPETMLSRMMWFLG